MSRYPSIVVFKPGGGYEYFHGTPTALSVAQFARESARATNLRTLSPHLFPQLVTQAEGRLNNLLFATMLLHSRSTYVNWQLKVKTY